MSCASPIQRVADGAVQLVPLKDRITEIIDESSRPAIGAKQVFWLSQDAVLADSGFVDRAR